MNQWNTTYTCDDADQLTVDGTSYTYDANGNLTSDGNRTYVYDAENRLIAVKDSGGNTIAAFTYRADGMRKTMTTSSGTITFHYDQNNNVVYETDENNRIVASYTYGPNNEPVSMTRDGKTYYYQTNYRGDVLALTDSSGNVVATYEYDAFGRLLKETGTVENPYRYAGYRYDKETGLYYLQSRYYNPETGRFLTRDTFEGDEQDPLSLNKYAYANNNPVMNTDSIGFGVLGAVIGWFITNTLVAVFWTVLQMSYYYGWKSRWPRRAFVETFIWNFASAAIPVAGWIRWAAKPMKQWILKYGKGTLRWIADRIIYPVVNWLKPRLRSAYSLAKQGIRRARGAIVGLVRKAFRRF